ncbi:hypothetical protein GCK32_022445, partial [Trichostrongylus colubriformis]
SASFQEPRFAALYASKCPCHFHHFGHFDSCDNRIQ